MTRLVGVPLDAVVACRLGEWAVDSKVRVSVVGWEWKTREGWIRTWGSPAGEGLGAQMESFMVASSLPSTHAISYTEAMRVWTGI